MSYGAGTGTPPNLPLTFIWGWALGAEIILAALNVVHSL